MGVETENYEIAAKGFENIDFVVCILVVRVSREILPVGYLKGRYKSESSLMTCVAELHGSVIRMPSSIPSHIGISNYGIIINPDDLEEAYLNITSFQSLNTFYNINSLS